jgi:dephospho-CoA kinase
MIVLGLTGSIGMGKSRVAAMLRRMGIPVHDSDKAVHEVLLPGGEAFASVAGIFPEAVEGNILNRQKLGNIVFHDVEKMRRLEAILHPVAQQNQMRFLKEMKRKEKRVAVLEIPLLFETGADRRVDYIICVTAPPQVQRRRVLARKGMTPEKFKNILEKQMPDAEKRRRSDFIVQTGMGYAYTWKTLRKILREIGI